ncbi:MAG: peptide chain release factor N(5)-glutamine methyltransferase [Phycisphaerales bacterium]|nr:peptide chain release factor N(5)-glutamine methyltransferase [Phycisphaerales bacterium]MCB9856431.1 peptide chain release factor N(5)-glutamine methyltransferase [Phycisphaerales bacterium]MCB9864562.1 peptide chain release factor N(5)-glutamine methyltransferase [Phycisphaerales bacterium]
MSNPAANTDVWSIGRLIDWTRSHLESKGVEDARLCAELLLAHAMGCQKILLYARFHKEPTDEQKARFRELVKAAAQHTPIAHLIGEREFYSLGFHVTRDVLIPRPETELIVEHALDRMKSLDNDTFDVLDIGTGSGCIAITIAKREPRAGVIATDISEAALDVARKNAERHKVTDRVAFVHTDLFTLSNGQSPPGGFDLVVSNPPYIGETERDSLPANVRDYEPAAALFAGESGLDCFRRMADGIRDILRPEGVLLLEIGEHQGDAVRDLFTAGGLEFVAAHRDLFGVERMLEFKRTS